MQRRSIETLAVAMAMVLWAGAAPGAADTPESKPAAQSRPTSRPESAPAQAEIRRMIRQLSHPSVTRRREAIRQLAQWGPLAFGELERAAKAPNIEEALSARDLLQELRSALLIGAKVRLAVKPDRVGWDQPVTLIVHADNPTPGPIRLPWPVPPAASQAAEAAADVRQVAAMMDAADFLVVTDPKGEEVSLRVEPIDRDPEVYKAVNVRAGDQPPSQEIAAGTSDELEIPLLNRGWARYPLFEPGTYTIRFAYQPQWKDASWTESGFGLVTSEPVKLTVTSGAPAEIKNADAPLLLTIRRGAGAFEAELRSTWDVPVWVNLNAGGEPATHARLEWFVSQAADDQSDDVLVQAEATDATFRAERLKRLDPGATMVVSSLSEESLRKRIVEAAIGGKKLALGVRYLGLATPERIRGRLTELGRDASPPTHLFSGAVVSKTIPVESTK